MAKEFQIRKDPKLKIDPRFLDQPMVRKMGLSMSLQDHTALAAPAVEFELQFD
jgi:hypothetical protein